MGGRDENEATKGRLNICSSFTYAELDQSPLHILYIERLTMHRVLLTPELLGMILHDLSPADLARVGRTCHALWSPAMALNWKTVRRLRTLLRLFESTPKAGASIPPVSPIYHPPQPDL